MADDDWGYSFEQPIAIEGEDILDDFKISDWEKEDPEPKISKPKPKKDKKIIEKSSNEIIQPKILTKKEQEELSRQSDLRIAHDIFTVKGQLDGLKLNNFDDASDFDAFKNEIINHISPLKENQFYSKFIEDLIINLASSLKPVRISYLSSQLGLLSHDKKQENKKTKLKKTNRVNLKAERNINCDLFDAHDVSDNDLDISQPKNPYYLEDDFM
ncbi:hypothetical protein HZS_1536 [Henneguya salminicola]|nr:hypothetical protein HZS_1536 [Henneguya salminicola]